MQFSFEQKLKAAPDTLINVIEGESVLLSLQTESYYGLDEIGTRMWSVLTTSETIQAAYETLLDEYEVDAETLRTDMQDLIDKLISHGLVEIGN